MILRFTCSKFRNVKVDELDFARINILLGPNNAGKSNFIRALFFAANMVNNAGNDSSGFLAEVQRNGTSAILPHNEKGRIVNLNWRIKLKEKSVDYTLAFKLGNTIGKCPIVNESVDSVITAMGSRPPFNYFRFHDEKQGYGAISTSNQMGEKEHRVQVRAAKDESVLLQFDKLIIQNSKLFEQPYVSGTLFPMLEEMRLYFSRFYAYMSSNFDFNKIRQLQDPNDAGNVLLKDGSNFLNVYSQACKSDPYFETRFLTKMQSIIPSLKEMKVVEGLDKIGMRLSMNGTNYMLSEISDGTIEILLLALLTSMPKKQAPSLLAIEEPEINLHPAWQAVLAKWLQISGNFTQCFISTHSPDFLDSFTEGFVDGRVNILVYDSIGKTTFKQLERKRVIGELKKGWLLGDLYRVNDPTIGGWPW